MDIAREPKLSFFAGFGFLFRGVRFIAGTPRLWPAALVPVCAALVVSVLVVFLGYRGVLALAPSLFAPAAHSFWADAGRAVLRVLLYLVIALASILLGTVLAQPISGPALDAIARAARCSVDPSAPAEEKASFLESAFRSLRVTSVTLLIGTPILLLLSLAELFVPPLVVVTWPLKLLVTALLATWDLIDYPMSLERRGVRDRTRWIRENFGVALGFGVGVALMTIVPFVGLFLLPCGVAGVTLLLRARGLRT